MEQRVKLIDRPHAPFLNLLGPVDSLGRIAADFWRELRKIDEIIGLTTQFVGNHGRLRHIRRNHRYADTLALNRFDKGAEIAVSRK